MSARKGQGQMAAVRGSVCDGKLNGYAYERVLVVGSREGFEDILTHWLGGGIDGSRT